MGKFSREERETLAQEISEVDADAEQGLYPRVAKLRQHGTACPSVLVEWKDLKVVTAATGSAGSLPSMPNILLNLLKVRLVFSRRTSVSVT
jgi:hypothetical protein